MEGKTYLTSQGWLTQGPILRRAAERLPSARLLTLATICNPADFFPPSFFLNFAISSFALGAMVKVFEKSSSKKMKNYTLLLVAMLGMSLGNAVSGQRTLLPLSAPQLAGKQVVFEAARRPKADAVATVVTDKFGFQGSDKLQSLRVDRDALGFEHHTFQQFHAGYPVFGAIQKAHIKNGEIMSLNGHYVGELAEASVVVTREAALDAAVSTTGVRRLQAQSPGQDLFLQKLTGDPGATWLPKGELMYAPNTLSNLAGAYRLAWKFDIYSAEPLFRADIYIDAQTGELIWRNETLHCADANGLGHTHYSGVRAIVTDSVGSYYRLQETGRALGVETYDMLNQTDYQQAVDVVQADNVWDSFPSPSRAAALDAHWGAEMTYDYFSQFFNRESYDDASSKLISYVHYDNNYSNAYWNGQFMTYGDGSGNNNPFSGLDVCGHEFTHGVTQFSAGLIYQNEPGALNESFSDIFGNSIEFWARANDASWGIGDDIGAFRSMANPQVFFNPDTYLGTYWATNGGDNGGVHTNSGVQNHWYYLLSDGGSGVNDNGDSYQVMGMGIDTAAQIAYRNLSVYLTPTDGYAAARRGSVQSAIDLYGECSPAMISTINAWYACGVGNPYTGTLSANFYTADSNGCTTPSDVQFTNLSLSGLHYFWDFGDGTTSTDENPLHTYTSVGDFTVTLIAYGCNGSSDTIVWPNRIHIDLNQPCTINMPSTGTTLSLASCEGILYDAGGSNDYPPNANSRVVLDQTGLGQVTLVFQSFNYAAGDRVSVFDGPSTASPQLGVFSGTALPPTFTSSNGALTILESTNGANNRAGFVATWSCLVGIENPDFEGSLQVFPNPTMGELQVRWLRNGTEPDALQLFDALGRMVLEQTGEHTEDWSQKLDLSRLPAGVYTLRLQAGDDQAVRRIIVQ
jgi:Zn-dependent metalloprotease